MNLRRHRKAVFATLGVATVATALALNVSWVVLNWRAGLQMVLGAFLFALIIAGVVLNTTFLLREIRRNEQHNNFINSVTHELKTPVASIRLYLETLQSRSVEESKRKDFYRIMLEDTDRLLHTIEQVLKAGQVSTGRTTERVPVSLSEIISHSLPLAKMRHRLPEKALIFANHLPPGASDIVLGDPADLHTAVLNLVDNAIKYSTGEPQVSVELARNDRDQLIVRVKDEGIGIPRDELKNVFQRFHRIQNSTTARIKGTGLGLFIVHSIAKRHKGRVFAESAGAGLGSTFTLELAPAPKEA
jgi:signal transduction histidine kinase